MRFESSFAVLGGRVAGEYAEEEKAGLPWFMPANFVLVWRLDLDGDPARGRSPGGVVSGVGRTCWAVPARGRVTLWAGVRLTPLSAYRVLGVPLDQLGSGDLDLADLYGGAFRDLLDALREAPPPRRRALVRGFIADRAARGPEPAPEVAQAWRRLAAAGGRVPVTQLADEAGWSRNHLIRRFRQQIGRTPGTMARLIRFRRVVARLEGGPPAPWDRLAAEYGYYDQAHLYREFREFAATTPAGFLSRRLACGCLGVPEPSGRKLPVHSSAFDA